MAGRKRATTKALVKKSAAVPDTVAPVGRPSLYDPAYCEQATKLCILGATDAEMGDFFGVSEVTINAWKTAHPEFLKSIKEGKIQADSKVARSLYRRALGYSHPAEKAFVIEGEIVPHEYVERYAPDTTAAIFWLKNRRPNEWRDKTTMEHEFGATVEAIITESWKH